MNNETENHIIKQIITGEHHLYSELTDTYQNRLFAFIFRMVKNREDALDITQETFFKAYRSLKSFRFKSKFSTWLFQIGYNNSINFIKKTSRRNEIEKELSIDNNYIDHETQLEIQEINRYIENEIMNIDKKYRAPLHLYFYEEKNYNDIAQILKIPVNTVKSHIHRGKSLIRNILSEKYNYEYEEII